MFPRVGRAGISGEVSTEAQFEAVVFSWVPHPSFQGCGFDRWCQARCQSKMVADTKHPRMMLLQARWKVQN